MFGKGKNSKVVSDLDIRNKNNIIKRRNMRPVLDLGKKDTSNNEITNICMYCGINVENFGNYPNDYGLHKQIDFSNLCTCDCCDKLITRTNRLLKKILDTNGREDTLLALEAHVNEIKTLYKN